MKTFRNKFLALLLITSVAFLSCKKEDQLTLMPINHSPGMSASPNTDPVISQNDWQITLYEVNKSNETKLFSEYAFKFASDGVLKAITRSSSVNGTWSEQNALNFVISFTSDPLSRLNNEWHIMTRTSTDIKLQRMNRLGGAEFLTFQRAQRQTEIDELSPN